MESSIEHNKNFWEGNPHTSKEAGRIICLASIEWINGVTYVCERDDPHDGEQRMHGASVVGEWTNWTDSFVAEHPEFFPAQ
jgi:hypothetical protein